MKSSLATARSRAPASTADESASLSRGASPAAGAGGGNPMAGLANLMGGMGGGGGGGGMPDLSSIMNNPAIMSMAQQMMANGGLERMMGNE